MPGCSSLREHAAPRRCSRRPTSRPPTTARDLHRDLAAERRSSVAAVDRAHAAAADLLDRRRSESVSNSGHAGDRPEPADSGVRQAGHSTSTPNSSRASRRNSSSVAHRTRSASSACSRKRRRASASALVTCVVVSPNSPRARRSCRRHAAPGRGARTARTAAACRPPRTRRGRRGRPARTARGRTPDGRARRDRAPATPAARASSRSAPSKSSATSCTSPPRLVRAAACRRFCTKRSAQSRTNVRNRALAGSKRSSHLFSNASAKKPCVASCASSGSRRQVSRKWV